MCGSEGHELRKQPRQATAHELPLFFRLTEKRLQILNVLVVLKHPKTTLIGLPWPFGPPPISPAVVRPGVRADSAIPHGCVRAPCGKGARTRLGR